MRLSARSLSRCADSNFIAPIAVTGSLSPSIQLRFTIHRPGSNSQDSRYSRSPARPPQLTSFGMR